MGDEYNGIDRRENAFCSSHYRREDAIDKLTEACTTNGAQLKMLMRILAWCAYAVIGMFGLTLGYITYTYQHSEELTKINNDMCEKISRQVVTSNSGISKNRNDIILINKNIEDHEIRLRRVEK